MGFRDDPFNTSGVNDWQDKYRTIQGAMAQQLWNFNSPLYQNFRSFLGSTTPTLGTNALLAPLMAGGGGMGASQVQANALQQNYLKQRNDYLNSATRGFAAGNIQQAGNLIGNAQQSYMGQEQLKAQVDSQKAGWDDFALALAPGLLAAPFTGGASLFGSGMALGGMSGGGKQTPQGWGGYGGYR